MNLLQEQCDVFCGNKKTKVTQNKNTRLVETLQMGILPLLLQGLLNIAVFHQIRMPQDL